MSCSENDRLASLLNRIRDAHCTEFKYSTSGAYLRFGDTGYEPQHGAFGRLGELGDEIERALSAHTACESMRAVHMLAL